MIFNGTIAMQPEQQVLVEPKVPTKVFAKWLHTLTQGLLSEKEKHQTFTAIAILQQLNIALRSAGIVNIVRLAKDGNDFYYDSQGKADDLAEAMQQFRMNNDRFGESLFNELYLVLEHQDEKLKYLIEIEVKRVHSAKTLPVNITINGVINEFQAGDTETADQLQRRLSHKLKNQSEYDKLINHYQNLFELFVSNLEHTLRSAIRCKAINQTTQKQLLRPASKDMTQATDVQRAPLVHRQYPGWEMAALYTFLWLPTMSSMSLQAAEVDVISDTGDVLQSIGADGVDAADSALFDVDIATAELPLDRTNRFIDGSSAGGVSAWLDFGGDGGDGGSGCGGGCGGGCGS